ncbi:MAG TPA: DUF3298 domain-containing protein [Bacteroidales bacterium]|nr:DUF3298 domain-containing protein [Bacteroidales bacterium]
MIRIPFLSMTILLLTIGLISCNKKAKEEVDAVSFRTISIKEAHHLNDNVKNPVLNIKLNYQYPTAYSDDSILKKIRKTMLADFIPNVVDTNTEPESAMRSYIQGKIKIYESAEDIVRDEDMPENNGQPGIAWSDNTNLLIRCNTGGLLSYTVESIQISGGAHGGSTFRNSVIDLKTGDKLGEEDLFTEASLPLINDIILKKLELQNKVESTEELEQIGYFDVSQIGQYKNFYLTQDGLVYTFNEYEIAAYAVGTIEVKLTFKDLEGFVSPGSPLEKFIHQ